jgi:hypothetical protein
VDAAAAAPAPGQALPTPSDTTSVHAAAPAASVTPLAAERFRLQLTLSRRARDLLLQAQALLRHRLPDGDLSQVCEEALALLVEQLQQRKFAKLRRRAGERAASESSREAPAPALSAATRDVAAGADATGLARQPPPPDPPAREPSPGQVVAPAVTGSAGVAGTRRQRTRTITAQVKRAVAARDGHRCAFIGAGGHRCNETAYLEYHHRVPFGRGGESTVANLELSCRVHNQLQAEVDYGAALIAARRRRSGDPGGVREVKGVYQPATAAA